MEKEIIISGYGELFGNAEIQALPLAQSGSDRKYFRIINPGKSIIGAYNANLDENKAFIGFSRHFREKSLPVPEIYGYIPEKFIYFLEDLGDVNLYSWLRSKLSFAGFDDESKSIYRKALDGLILFQIRGIEGLDLQLCYPHRSFDRQSMMWDMNYFKYMFLKLISVPFNEKKLELDFNKLADYLLKAGQDYFLYRDFQTANIMIKDENPWFIDYQGGRKGAPQYDVASLLYDAKISMNDDDREELLDYYIFNFCSSSGENAIRVREYFNAFSMIRLMQALGAFGFRGLYEQKPTFTESIVPAVKLLKNIAGKAVNEIDLKELYSIINAITETKKFNNLAVRSNQ